MDIIDDDDTLVPVDTDPADDVLVDTDDEPIPDHSLVAMEPVPEDTIPEIPDTIPDIIPDSDDALPMQIDDDEPPLTEPPLTEPIPDDSMTVATDPVDKNPPTTTPGFATSTSTMLDTPSPTLSVGPETPASKRHRFRIKRPSPDSFYKVATILLFSLFVILLYVFTRRLWVRKLSKKPWVARLLARRGAQDGPDDGLLALDPEDSDFDGNPRQSTSVFSPVLRFGALAVDLIFMGDLTRGRIFSRGHQGHDQQLQDVAPTGGSDVDIGVLPPGVYAYEEPRQQEQEPVDPAKLAPKEADIAYHQAINDIRRVPRQPDNQPGSNADELRNGTSGTALSRPLVGSIKKLFGKKEPGLPVQEVPRVQWPPRPRNDGGDQHNMRTRPEGEYRNVHYANITPAAVLQRSPERPLGLSTGARPVPQNISQPISPQGLRQGPRQGLQQSPHQSPQQIYHQSPQQNHQQSPRRKPTPMSDMTKNALRGPPSTLKQAHRLPSGQGQGQTPEEHFLTYPLHRVKNNQRHPTPTLMCRPDAQDEITVRSIIVD